MDLPVSSCVIVPEDFSALVTDTNRRNWLPGKMRHVVAALDGEPVAITTDRMTGHAVMGVRLLGLTSTPSSGECVVVQGEEPFWPRPVAHRLLDCGVVMPLTEVGARAKWAALDSYHEEGSAAIQRAKREHPECDHGKWTATPGRSGVGWRYDPQYSPDHNAAFKPIDPQTRRFAYARESLGMPTFAYGSYSLDQLAEERNWDGRPFKLALVGALVR